MTGGSVNCADRQMILYNAIRDRISQSFFSRAQMDEEELLHDVFVKLADKYLPPFGSEEMTKLINGTITNTVRVLKRAQKAALDIDDIEPDDEPVYDMAANFEEEEFEAMFDRFCDSRDEPERTIFRRFRTHNRQALAACSGVYRYEVARILKTLPRKFEDFVKKFLE